jgi:hypothetical protein
MKLLNVLNKLDLAEWRRMSKLMQNNKRSNLATRINELCMCISDNITTIPMYHTHDKL